MGLDKQWLSVLVSMGTIYAGEFYCLGFWVDVGSGGRRGCA